MRTSSQRQSMQLSLRTLVSRAFDADSVLDRSVQICHSPSMARPKELDRDAAVERAMSVFWLKGYAATSTDDLLRAMKIGRQSMYDTFGDKRRLYVEALKRYSEERIAEHIRRLRSPVSPLAGIEALVLGLIFSDRAAREKGCMGIGSISEFGCSDPELAEDRAKNAAVLRKALLER